MMLPIHIPVFLCGLLCGSKYGLLVGMLLSLIRSFIFTMPPIYPTVISMSLELATYGFVIRYVYEYAKYQNTKTLYSALLISMISSRFVWAITQILLLNLGNNTFTWHMFISGVSLNEIPWILLQLILIPAIMVALDKRV